MPSIRALLALAKIINKMIAAIRTSTRLKPASLFWVL
jgi:hypothetical protein